MLQLLFFTKFVSKKYSVCRVLRQRINWPANYERQLGNKPGPGIRAGIGYASSTGEFRVSVPVGINYLLIFLMKDHLLKPAWASHGLKRAFGKQDFKTHLPHMSQDFLRQ
jgi:hypothetical protein